MTPFTRRHFTTPGTATLLAVGLLLSACADPSTVNGGASSAAIGTQAISSTASPKTTAAGNAAGLLHDQLPDKIKNAGQITSVNTGSFPPYTIIGDDHNITGATADLETAMGKVLGIKFDHVTVDSLAGSLTGIAAGRYDLEFGPVGDFPERQVTVDFVQEFVVFAVPKGNPKQINDLESACGAKIAVQAGGSAEKVVTGQATKCKAAGKPALEVQSFKDQPSSILAVQSGRSDAFFSSQAPLTYFVQQSGGKLELAGVGKGNGFKKLFQGMVLPKNSPLVAVLLQAWTQLYADGTYQAVMNKWGLTQNMLPKAAVNLGRTR